MAETIISLMERCAYWATYVTPMVERNKGWLAFVLRDRVSASYHLNRALLEARRMELSHQEIVTKELMQKLGISLLGDSGKKLMGECPHHAAIKACVNAIFGSSASETVGHA